MDAPRIAHARARGRREERARQIVAEHAREIAESDRGSIYRVPGSNGTGYVVSLSRGVCECADFEHRGEPCKHIQAAGIVNAKCRQCADCGNRFLGRDLVEVEDGHLTWFEGDELCRQCALSWSLL